MTAADRRGLSVLIIGASSGIGLASALNFAADGARLTLMARDLDSLQRAEEQCRAVGAADVHLEAGDVTRRPDVDRAVQAAGAEFGRLDAVVHTATVMAYGTVEELPAEVFTTVVDVAIHGTLHVGQAVLPVLRQQGSGVLIIVNSLLGSVAVPYMGAYSTAKWGQRAIARTLQQETRDAKDVHVCIVSPGSTNTPIYYQAANHTGYGARPPFPVLQPEQTARVIAGLVTRPRDHVSIPVGPTNPVIVAGFRLAPKVYDMLVGPLFRLVSLTRERVEPTAGNVEHPRASLDAVPGHWPAER